MSALTEYTGFIVAGVGALASVGAWVLNKRGQSEDIRLKHGAASLAERVQAFDELESLNDRQRAELDALRAELARMSTSGDRALQRQANRCHAQLEGLVSALSTLQSVVLDEVARTAAEDVVDEATEHLADDHGLTPGDGYRAT